MSNDIKPGSLVVYKDDYNHTLLRVLRVYTKEEVTYPNGYTATGGVYADSPYAEVIPLVNLKELTPTRNQPGGTYVNQYRLADLQPYAAQRREIFDDLRTRLRRLESQIRIYESTVACDPTFQIQKWSFDALVEEIKDAPGQGALNTQELAIKIYGECYPNAHVKIKLV